MILVALSLPHPYAIAFFFFICYRLLSRFPLILYLHAYP